MEVSPNKPFKIVYALYEHQYLGYLFESFAVQLDHQNKLTYQHQNISSLNAAEFDSKLDETDYELIRLMDDIQQDAIMRRFAPKNKKNKKLTDFFLNTYHPENGDKVLRELIQTYLESKRTKILSKLHSKLVFEMGNDGEPTARTIKVHDEKASVLFHFRKNDDNTHYFPTIKFAGEKLDFNYQGAVIICYNPAWMLIKGNLFTFERNIDGNKLKPFLRKKFIAIPKKIEEDYYHKFVKNLIEDFDVYARGFDIKKSVHEPRAKLQLTEIVEQQTGQLFGQKAVQENGDHKMCFSVAFSYNGATVEASSIGKRNYVELEKEGDYYIFNKISRDTRFEKATLSRITELGLDFSSSKTILPKEEAFEWLSENVDRLAEEGIDIEQSHQSEKVYFVGQSSISIEVSENRDWFDINAKVRFGEFEIPFLELRKWMVRGQKEFTLPNGETAVIPESWFTKYHELFHFMDNSELKLKKHHISLVQELQEGELAKVAFDRKLERLRDFDKIEDYPDPKGFKGTLRPYQKAGFNWMRFLSEYNFGGCLADDMGLGKTVQTLALMQHQKESEKGNTSLLIMPTSLLYNWEMEAKKFTPKLKVLKYAGTNRNKNPEIFGWYDLVITSYGIARIDADILTEFYFDYIILDESQTIKNPQSGVAKAVKQLKSRRKLLLTGTPIENTTMDLWSQMSFANPGLLGGQSFFKKEFLQPIEKKNDEDKYKKLHSIIKPFIMRRIKSQVATELPNKVEKVMYTEMTEEQQKRYDEVKSSYRNEILEQIEKQGLNNSQFMLLKGLTELRQIANHPRMVDKEFDGDSGKMMDVIRTLESAIANNHKTLIFSQFVKHLHIIKEYLDENKIKYSYLDGTTKNRKEQVDKFQNDKKQQVFLISLKAGGLGLNLTAADYVFILDPWWNPAIEAQAIDRAHRIGQENKVFVYKFITKDSVEEKILALQQNKLDLANSLISTEESFMKKLSKDDIEALLS